MIRPDDEEKPFVARWNSLIRILLVESSVKAVARAAMDYADFYDGTSCHPSNERLARETLYDERTVRSAWAMLRGLGLAERVRHGVPQKRIADEYELQIPDDWAGMAILGPRSDEFACLHCGADFNPPAVAVLTEDGRAAWALWKACFCKPPRKTKGRNTEHCLVAWNAARRRDGEPTWSDLDGPAAWKLFREARADDW